MSADFQHDLNHKIQPSHILLFMIILAFMITGCSGGGGDDPVTPGTDPDPAAVELTGQNDYPATSDGVSGKAIWGYWDVAWDPADGFTVVPLRNIEYSLNVNEFLQPPMGSISNLGINMVNMEKLFIAGDCTVDVSLTHPFPSLQVFTGFDVLGVFISGGGYTSGSDIGIHYPNPDTDAILKNADGYTRWMNQMEFTTGGLTGYTEGAAGNKHEFWGSTLNAYKYFATGLLVTERIADHYQSSQSIGYRGMFSTNATNTRRYDIHFPMSNGFPVVRFQYAVVASWVEPVNNPPQALPGDFPAEANMQEAFHCEISTVGSSLYWNNMYDNGGDLFLTLEIFDWQGMSNSDGVEGEILQIILDSPDTFINGGTKMVFNPGDWIMTAGDSPNSVKLSLDVGTVDPGGPCPFDNDVLVTIVTAEQGNYDNGLGAAYPTQGVLSGYARLFYDLGNVCNDPPVLWFVNCPSGTVSTSSRTLKWDAEDDVTPNVQLEYQYKLDNEAWSAWETNLKYAAFEGLTEAPHTVYVRCRDMDGQETMVSCSFEVDLPPEPQPPTVDFANCTAYVRESPHNWNLLISDDTTPISSMKVRYNLDGAGWVNMADGTTTIILGGLVSGGPHQLMVEVEDMHTMVDQAVCDFDVDFLPNVTIDNCPSQDINATSYPFDWTGTDPEMGIIEYSTQLDTEGWSGWGPAMNLTLNSLSSGNHVFYVRVRDLSGGIHQTSCSFTVNLPPTITITNPPAQDVNATAYNFTWNATDDLDSPLTLDYNVELDGVWQGWSTGISDYNWTPITSGPHTFRVRVRDSGNPELWVEDSCAFDVNFPPIVTIDDCPAGIWASADITFNWTGLDDNSLEANMDYQYQLDADPWTAWSTGQLSVNLVGLADGPHTIRVRVRDTGTPALTCVGPPSTCDECAFTIDSSCSVPPANVTNFAATQADASLNPREVELTWDVIAGCVDTYEIDRREWVTGVGWQWMTVQTVAHPTNSWIDTNARYSGPLSPIEYRIIARNVSGTSPVPATASGWPLLRNVKMHLWCVRDDAGLNPSTTWARAAADFTDCNTFWNQYGINFDASENFGNFTFIDSTALQDLTGAEDSMMHSTYGQATHPDSINVYFVKTSNGNNARGYAVTQCPGTAHNSINTYIVLCEFTREDGGGNVNPIVLAHECGHAFARFWDQYLLDTNGNIILDDGTTCAADNLWCTGPAPMTPPLFCDDTSSYPENPGAFGKIPKQLMWYSFQNAPIPDYTITAPQYFWMDSWIHGDETKFPWP